MVLLQTLTGGHRFWVGAAPGAKSLSSVLNERIAAQEVGDSLQALHLLEHLLTLRVQQNGIWSDANHASSNYVTRQDVTELVKEYNDTAASSIELVWTADLLRKAHRLVTDRAMVGDGKTARKHRAKVLNSMAADARIRGKTVHLLQCSP